MFFINKDEITLSLESSKRAKQTKFGIYFSMWRLKSESFTLAKT